MFGALYAASTSYTQHDLNEDRLSAPNKKTIHMPVPALLLFPHRDHVHFKQNKGPAPECEWPSQKPGFTPLEFHKKMKYSWRPFKMRCWSSVLFSMQVKQKRIKV